MSHICQMLPKPLRLKVISSQHDVFQKVVVFFVFENDPQHKCNDILKKTISQSFLQFKDRIIIVILFLAEVKRLETMS